jgi:hypothetical protein
MAEGYFSPEFLGDAYHCPYCNVYAHQSWVNIFAGYGNPLQNPSGNVSSCGHCHMSAIWIEGRLLFPPILTAPPAHNDLQEPARSTYMEARNLLEASPRSAAALLRLCLQELIISLGVTEDNLNKAVGELVKLGLPTQIQQAMDTVRLIGNEAVHPGTINVNDNPEIAMSLFELVNAVVETMITQPRKIGELYGRLPQGKLEAIKERDQGTATKK